MKVEVSDQVLAFCRTLAPEPRRLLRDGLRRLEREEGDVQPLEGALMGFYRLRLGRYRVVFHYVQARGRRVLRCEYAGERSIIYQMFSQLARQVKPEEMRDAPTKD
ncbi:MAG TPA: hypothetical protein PKE12_10070 [Kiritimatiellia bacterium]|nr:hypothetical protein [Kiritimatiellia bacterium]